MGIGRSRDSTGGKHTLVGRENEMAVLTSALEEARGGQGSIVMLAGEPGIGKTRLCEETVAAADDRGMLTLWGRCYEGGGAPPYWPWAQAIRSYVRSVDAGRLKRELGSGAGAVGEVVPELREAIPGLSLPPPLEDPESARFRLFDSIASFLQTASHSQPLLIVLDDLHWSDRQTLLLLEFVARELAGSRIMLVGAYRDIEVSRRHPLAMTLGELTRERHFERVPLRGLGETDVARFLELTSGAPPPQALVRAVYAQTEGNPLFMVEIIRDLAQSGELTESRVRNRSTRAVRVPESVRDVIGRRLSRLSDDCIEALIEAAVMGRQFRLPVLLKLVSDASESTLLDLLDEAVAARVIEELPSEAGLYQFTHSLIQDTLRSEVSRNRAVRTHARIAQALEEHYGEGAEAHAAELAEHYAEAESMLGSSHVVKYAYQAGLRALRNYAYDDAMRHFERALESLEPGPMSHEHALVLLGLGQAQAGALGRADRHRAVETLIRAISYFLEHDDTENAARALLTDVVPVDGGADHGGTDIVRLMEMGIALAPEGKADRARALLKYAYAVFVETRNLPKAEIIYESARQIVDQLDHEPLALRAIQTRFGIDIQKRKSVPRSDYGIEKAINRAAQLAEKYIELRLRYFHARWSWQVAKSDEIVKISDAFLAAALPVGDMNNLENAYVYAATARALRGDWPLAERHYEEYRRRLPGRATFAVFQVLIKCELGDADSAQRLLEEFRFQNLEPPTSTNDLWHAAVGALPHIGALLGDEYLLEFARKAAVTQLRSAGSARMAYWAAISCASQPPRRRRTPSRWR
ncbi:MAG: ATP-binding protein, partial [Chloroflexota bacterium]